MHHGLHAIANDVGIESEQSVVYVARPRDSMSSDVHDQNKEMKGKKNQSYYEN